VRMSFRRFIRQSLSRSGKGWWPLEDGATPGSGERLVVTVKLFRPGLLAVFLAGLALACVPFGRPRPSKTADAPPRLQPLRPEIQDGWAIGQVRCFAVKKQMAILPRPVFQEMAKQ